MRRTGQRLLKFDRKLGARLVAGADEAGRGSLAGPLVVAGVLLDYGALKEHRVRPLTYLNDSKQCSEERREALFHAVLGCAEKIAVRVIPANEIDRNGLHRSNLAGLRAMLDRVLALTRRSGYRLLEAEARTRLAAIHLTAGRLDAALEQAECALTGYRGTGHRLGTGRGADRRTAGQHAGVRARRAAAAGASGRTR